MNQFKAGDVVVLKSGGPSMTVESVRSDAGGNIRINCMWFDGPKVQRELFSPDSLELCDKDE